MKIIDGFLKLLKTDRNTFVTYILTLVTVYLAVDRIVEMLFIIFTGVSVSYWGPIAYTLALACPVAAFYFSGPSKFIKSDQVKISFFILYCIGLFIIGISMLVQWVNYFGWLLLISVPNYWYIATITPEIIGPAFKAIAAFIPVVAIPPFFKFLYFTVNDTKLIKDSILDYGGISLSSPKSKSGVYSCEIAICKDKKTGGMVIVPESRRYEACLVVGVSGSGKTSMVFEPMLARDIEKKHFLKSVSKELAFTALKSGVAVLNCPYANDYINEHFNLNMIAPNPYKENVYNSYMKDLIHDSEAGNLIYKDLGITYLSPDIESIKHIQSVATNFNLKYNLIDPDDPQSMGLNPFVHRDPTKSAIIISSIIRGMSKTLTLEEASEVLVENLAMQIVENLSILLREMYPRLNNEKLPNLKDMVNMLNDFSLIEDMCNELAKEPHLAEKYNMQLAYFKKHFFKDSHGKIEMEKSVALILAQLDNLLRYPTIRNVICNRTNNVDFDEALSNGQITLACTRRGDLGANAHQAFGLFFILLMQYSVLTRPGNERSRIPHFFYIDEFSNFVGESTMPIFTLYRKYRVGPIVSSQSLGQFDTVNQGDLYRRQILGNCSTKVVFGNNTQEENAWWQDEFGTHRDWKYKQDYDTEKMGYSDKMGQIEWGWTDYAKKGKIQNLKFKVCFYKTKDSNGANIIGQGAVDFLESKYKEKKKDKVYAFEKFNKASSNSNYDDNEGRKKKFNFSNVNFVTDNGDVDPVHMNNDTNSNFFFNHENGISINFNKKKDDDDGE
ncbi:MAG: TraM recognition domain-containing protein [Oscillospiraceae bacterium]|nr:TraM recognition domain-containing protein [Oscillospiraceae bacterium]